jgi:hypothetical protein
VPGSYSATGAVDFTTGSTMRQASSSWSSRANKGLVSGHSISQQALVRILLTGAGPCAGDHFRGLSDDFLPRREHHDAEGNRAIGN